MRNGKNCPKCGKDIGFWAWAKASWPAKVFCRHCKTKLRYTNVHILSTVFIIVMVLVTVLGFLITDLFVPKDNLLLRPFVAAAFVIVGAVPIVILFTIYVRFKKQLVLIESLKSKKKRGRGICFKY